MLVSSSGATQADADATALLATLPKSLVPGSVADDPALERDLTPRTFSRPGEQASDEAARTDFLTSACGLVLGIGLATGPIYPDLIGLVRTCLPRVVRPSGKARRGAGRGNRSLQKFMSWLRTSARLSRPGPEPSLGCWNRPSRTSDTSNLGLPVIDRLDVQAKVLSVRDTAFDSLSGF